MHKEKVDNLKSDGLLDAFIDLKLQIIRKVIDYIKDDLPLNVNQVCEVEVEYDIATLIMKRIRVLIEDAASFFNVSRELNKFGMVEVKNTDSFNVTLNPNVA